jgi:hypothetical protein
MKLYAGVRRRLVLHLGVLYIFLVPIFNNELSLGITLPQYDIDH